ncbi:MAG: MATE family efflux transporter [Fusobacterium sp.]|uniref:MATE family efflux transporter n=1 Tax=Fusobacterium sp. TaxID=68766 RepID=UPI0026DB8B60|nr:MATE family efflux transporter [Fusobacterium sp.]MDO4690692.1 MATE family efflux transporter [Fusobacterium sp.]
MSILSKDKNEIIQGLLWKSFIFYFFPILMSNLVQQSYSIVDAIIIGNFAGKESLAAIDAPLAYIRLLISTFIALSSGGGIVISQAFGKKDWSGIKNNISILLNLSLFGGIILTGIGIIFAPKFLRIMLVPEDIFNLSLVYLRVYFSGTVFVFLYNIISGILQAMGDSKNPFIYLTISSILNIFLDIVFVAYFKMGTLGAALATIMSQGVATVLIFYRLLKYKDFFLFKIFNYRRDKEYLIQIFILGLPMAMQAIIFSIANMFMQREINSFGTLAIAGWSISGKADFLIWNTAESLGLSVTTFVAQNYGANKLKRVKRSVLYAFFLGSILFIIFSSTLYIYIDYISALFTQDKDAIDMSVFLMRIIAPFYIFYMFSEVFGGAVRGMGNTFYPMLCSLVGICIFRLSWIFFILPKNRELATVIITYPWSWFISACLHFISYIYYYKFKKN